MASMRELKVKVSMSVDIKTILVNLLGRKLTGCYFGGAILLAMQLMGAKEGVLMILAGAFATALPIAIGGQAFVDHKNAGQ